MKRERQNIGWNLTYAPTLSSGSRYFDISQVQHAVNNALTLAQWLGSAAGEPVNVTPILALPGWLVESSAACPDSRRQPEGDPQGLPYGQSNPE